MDLQLDSIMWCDKHNDDSFTPCTQNGCSNIFNFFYHAFVSLWELNVCVCVCVYVCV